MRNQSPATWKALPFISTVPSIIILCVIPLPLWTVSPLPKVYAIHHAACTESLLVLYCSRIYFSGRNTHGFCSVQLFSVQVRGDGAALVARCKISPLFAESVLAPTIWPRRLLLYSIVLRRRLQGQKSRVRATELWNARRHFFNAGTHVTRRKRAAKVWAACSG